MNASAILVQYIHQTDSSGFPGCFANWYFHDV